MGQADERPLGLQAQEDLGADLAVAGRQRLHQLGARRAPARELDRLGQRHRHHAVGAPAARVDEAEHERERPPAAHVVQRLQAGVQGAPGAVVQAAQGLVAGLRGGAVAQQPIEGPREGPRRPEQADGVLDDAIDERGGPAPAHHGERLLDGGPQGRLAHAPDGDHPGHRQPRRQAREHIQRPPGLGRLAAGHEQDAPVGLGERGGDLLVEGVDAPQPALPGPGRVIQVIDHEDEAGLGRQALLEQRRQAPR
ncbi:MAG: hypothetical protein R3F43_29880, partial [bacterium]